LRIAGRIVKYALIGVMVFHDVRVNLHWLDTLKTNTWYIQSLTSKTALEHAPLRG
jgi:hypothetical protein